MPPTKRATVLKAPSAGDVEAMVISHERALFGYTDRDSLRVVPGLLARIDEAHQSIEKMGTSIDEIKLTLLGVPELLRLGNSLKKYGAYGTCAIIALLLAVVFHQYGLVPTILNAIGVRP